LGKRGYQKSYRRGFALKQQKKAAFLKRKEQYEDEVRWYAFDIFSGEVLEKIMYEGKP
jgi:hypothetical protein